MHLSPTFGKGFHHTHHFHAISIHHAMMRCSTVVHDSRFWAAVIITALLALLVTFGIMAGSSTVPEVRPYYNLYGLYV